MLIQQVASTARVVRNDDGHHPGFEEPWLQVQSRLESMSRSGPC